MRPNAQNLSAALPANEDALCNMFKKKFTAKQQLPSNGFFDQAAEPVQHARLGLFLADRSGGIKFLIERNIGWSGSESSGTALRRTIKLNVCGTVRSGSMVQRWDRSAQTEGGACEDKRAQ